jgi:hypothetical protein
MPNSFTSKNQLLIEKQSNKILNAVISCIISLLDSLLPFQARGPSLLNDNDS